ncbi:MAG: ferrous iron transport protein B [Verrucomicrobiae bacterium]|nr:ferrous iron transport protein B [Verrucomicrobiae bacterium]NNJ43696.1 ferrous iron transport protein B [Akkermansiaceae bacterium]
MSSNLSDQPVDHPSSDACLRCPSRHGLLRKLGVNVEDSDYVVALAGNPNTGKTTVFNALTGLRMHTGNWPGKTISRAEGAFSYDDKQFKIVDLPGTYSLLSASPDEEVARGFLLFGQPDVTLIVVDATSLERNLNLTLQVLQITRRAVICLNLMDEAEAHGIEIDVRHLSRELGVPVVPCSARSGEGVPELLREVAHMAKLPKEPEPLKLKLEIPGLRGLLKKMEGEVKSAFPDLQQTRWVALRLLEGDREVIDAVRSKDLAQLSTVSQTFEPQDESAYDRVLTIAHELSWGLPQNLHDRVTETIYGEAAKIASRSVTRQGRSSRLAWQQRVDRLLTHPVTAFPVMLAVLGVVLWLTITGANLPSQWLATLLVDQGHTVISSWFEMMGSPAWLKGLVVDGMYLATAWVISVMLPPMAIFFPCFTLLEDLGFLPRVAFNLDRMFQKVGAHGKQALTMAMGLGCNAAGVVAARVIDSPRERLIAIITNNFALCNGRWPTQILLATIFIGAAVPAAWSSLAVMGSVFLVTLLGFGLTLLSSWMLARTVLRGEATSFSLELPPYRPPQILSTLYRSLIDRTLIVLWRAVVFALPAGAVIWLVANVSWGDHSLAHGLIAFLESPAQLMGLTGVILLAYIVAIPANEIVIPTILMLSVLVTGQSELGEGAGVMFETGNEGIHQILMNAGWTMLTVVSLMLFSLCHNPCSTTIYTIYRETRSWKWTWVATFLPLVFGVVICVTLATVWRVFV